MERADAEVPGGDLGRFIFKLHRAYGVTLAPAISRIWLQRLRGVPISFLRSVARRHAESEDPGPTAPPTIQDFIEAWQEQQQRPPIEHRPANDERVARHELTPMRDQVRALVAVRVGCPAFAPPLDPDLPAFVHKIVRVLAAEAKKLYPEGVPLERADLVVSYAKRAVTLYDAEVAAQFELEHTA